MKKGLIALAALVAAPAFAQTTTTNCQQFLNQINCTSRSQEQSSPADAANFTTYFQGEADRQHRERLLQQQQADAMQRAREREQADDLRRQNDMLRRQLQEQQQHRSQQALVSAEVAVLKRALVDIVEEELARPENQRMTGDALGAAILDRAASALGHRPQQASVDAFLREADAFFGTAE